MGGHETMRDEHFSSSVLCVSVGASVMSSAQLSASKHVHWVLDRRHWNLWCETVFRQSPQDFQQLGWPNPRSNKKQKENQQPQKKQHLADNDPGGHAAGGLQQNSQRDQACESIQSDEEEDEHEE